MVNAGNLYGSQVRFVGTHLRNEGDIWGLENVYLGSDFYEQSGVLKTDGSVTLGEGMEAVFEQGSQAEVGMGMSGAHMKSWTNKGVMSVGRVEFAVGFVTGLVKGAAIGSSAGTLGSLSLGLVGGGIGVGTTYTAIKKFHSFESYINRDVQGVRKELQDWALKH